MKHIARSTLIIAVFFGLEKILGFFRQVMVARTFGRSAELDAFNAANNIPDLLFVLISGGALAMAFIPVLSEYLEEKGQTASWDLFSSIANLVFLVTAGFSILVAIFAEPLVTWRIGIAPGFGPEQQILVADLMRLNLLATLLLSISGLFIAGLQANQHFLLPAMANAMYDIGTLIGIFILVPETGFQVGPITLPAFGLGIHGLVYGTILGSFLFMAIQVPGLIRYGFRWKPILKLRSSGVHKVLILLGPRVLTVGFIQVIFLAQDNLASRLVEGSVTALVYGWLFMQVPETLMGTALATALLPTLSEHIAREDFIRFKTTLNQSIRAILAITIPTALFLSLGLEPIIAILGFDELGTQLVLWTARAFMLGLMGHSLIEVGARAFYAQQDARTPMLVAGLTAVSFLVFGVLLYRGLGAPGIALANTIAFSLEALILLYLLHRSQKMTLMLGKAIWRIPLGTLIGGVLVYFGMQIMTQQVSSALWQGVFAAAIMGIGLLAALPLLWPEIRLIFQIESRVDD